MTETITFRDFAAKLDYIQVYDSNPEKKPFVVMRFKKHTTVYGVPAVENKYINSFNNVEQLRTAKAGDHIIFAQNFIDNQGGAITGLCAIIPKNGFTTVKAKIKAAYAQTANKPEPGSETLT